MFIKIQGAIIDLVCYVFGLNNITEQQRLSAYPRGGGFLFFPNFWWVASSENVLEQGLSDPRYFENGPLVGAKVNGVRVFSTETYLK